MQHSTIKSLNEIIDCKLRELLEEFFHSLNLGFSKHTIRAYIHDIYSGISSDTTWQDINHPSKIRWRHYFATRYTLSDFSRALSAWKSFLSFCQKKGNIITSGILKIRRQKVYSKVFHVPSTESIQNTITEECGWIAARNNALIALLYSTGLRISEALSLRGDIYGDYIRVCGKGQKIRDVALLPTIKILIDKYRNLCPFDTNNALFVGARGKPLTYPSVYAFMQGMPWGSGAHGLRRSAATHLLRAGMDVESVRLLLGHSNLSTTQRYIKNDSEYLQKIYNLTQDKLTKK